MTKFQIDRRRRGFSYWLASTKIATLTMILPANAVLRASNNVEPIYIAAYLTIVSAITTYAYWSDKRKAKSDSWRTPEGTLHMLELAGGWLAAFFAQRIFRHKISKKEYQFAFWMIAALHHYAAIDYMNEWHYTETAFKLIGQI